MNGGARGRVDFDSISQTGCALLRSPLSPTIPGPCSEAGSHYSVVQRRKLAPMLIRSSRRRHSLCNASTFLRERRAPLGLGCSDKLSRISTCIALACRAMLVNDSCIIRNSAVAMMPPFSGSCSGSDNETIMAECSENWATYQFAAAENPRSSSTSGRSSEDILRTAEMLPSINFLIDPTFFSSSG